MKLIFLLAVALLAAAIVPASASAESHLFGGPKFVSFSDDDTVFVSSGSETKEMELKATNNNGKSKLVSNYEITADNVVTVSRSGQVTVFSNSDVEFTKALISGNEVPISNNGIVSFAGYPQGTYALNVVINDEYAYEAIVVVGAQAEQLIQREIVKENTRLVTDIDIETIFEVEEEDDDNNDDKDRNGPDNDNDKDIGFPYCDLVSPARYKAIGTCFDRQDYDDSTGLASCRDGSKVSDYRDCKDAGDHPDEKVKQVGEELADVLYDEEPEPEPTLFGSSTSTPTTPTPTPAPTPNALARGLLPTTPSPTLDNPCEAIPEPDIPECKDLPAETPEPTPLPPIPTEESQILPFYPDENTVDIPNVPLEDTVEEEVEKEEPEEEEPEEETAEEESGSEGESSE